MIYKTPRKAVEHAIDGGERSIIYHGSCNDLIAHIPESSIDLIVTSPPYCMGKSYEKGAKLEDFKRHHAELLPRIVKLLKPGGSICWQVGSYVDGKGVLTPLDFVVHTYFDQIEGLLLRNRIVWTFGHGLHCKQRFSGRYETILWYTKGISHHFNLDAVRVPQKYPGKLAWSGPRKGKPTGNPLGKNPGDVWDLPNVKAKHVEKTAHPCQFPVALVQRLVRALTDTDAIVFDPFSGVASSGVAALLENRRFIGSEINAKFVTIARDRLKAAAEGLARVRPLDQEIKVAGKNSRLYKRPWTDSTAGEDATV
jgi:adenine-specific DNA-methyltransferase